MPPLLHCCISSSAGMAWHCCRQQRAIALLLLPVAMPCCRAMLPRHCCRLWQHCIAAGSNVLLRNALLSRTTAAATVHSLYEKGGTHVLFERVCLPARTYARSCVWLSLARALSCACSLSLSLALSLARSLSLALSRALSLALSLSLGLFVSLSRSLAVSLSVSLSLSLSRSLSLALSLSRSLARALSLSRSLSHPFPLRSLSLCLSVSLCSPLRSRFRSLSSSLVLSLSLSLFILIPTTAKNMRESLVRSQRHLRDGESQNRQGHS